MYALNVMEPGATLAVRGVKALLGRSVPMPEYDGPIAVVSMRCPPPARWRDRFTVPLMAAAAQGFVLPPDLTLAPGHIVGVVYLDACMPLSKAGSLFGKRPWEGAFGDFKQGGWVWRVSNPVAFEAPIPIMPSRVSALYRLHAEVIEAVESLIAPAARS